LKQQATRGAAMIKYKITFETGIHKYIDATGFGVFGDFVIFWDDDNNPIKAYRVSKIEEISIA
jgi:selenophosphate synthase